MGSMMTDGSIMDLAFCCRWRLRVLIFHVSIRHAVIGILAYLYHACITMHELNPSACL